MEPAGHLEGAASAAAAAAGAAGAAGATGATGAGATAARPAPAAARCSLRPCGPQSASAGQPSSAVRFLGLLLLLPLPSAHRPLLPAAGRVAWGGGEAAASTGSWPHTVLWPQLLPAVEALQLSGWARPLASLLAGCCCTERPAVALQLLEAEWPTCEPPPGSWAPQPLLWGAQQLQLWQAAGCRLQAGGAGRLLPLPLLLPVEVACGGCGAALGSGGIAGICCSTFCLMGCASHLACLSCSWDLLHHSKRSRYAGQLGCSRMGFSRP